MSAHICICFELSPFAGRITTEEPGRIMVSALLSRARRARGCSTPGDDRLETRAYALKRYLHRLGHAQRSARYATSIAQLVVG